MRVRRSPLWANSQTKPPFRSVGIGWGHPLTRGLVTYVPLSEGGGSGHDLVRGVVGSSLANLLWQTGATGSGLRDPAANQNGGNLFAGLNPLAGLTNATVISWLYQIAGWSAAKETLGFARWEVSSTFLMNRKDASATTSHCILTMSTTNADLTVTDGMTVTGQQHCIAWVLSNLVLSCYIDGFQVGGTATGVGTITSNPTDGYALFAGGTSGAGSQENLTSAVGLAGGLYNRALSAAELLWLTAEPYDFLQPVIRRRYFVLPGSAEPPRIPASPLVGNLRW